MTDLHNTVITPITLYVDKLAANAPAYIYAKQNDVNSRYIKVTIMGASGRIALSGTAQLNAKKRDGTFSYTAGEINDDDTVTFKLTQQLLANVDTIPCDVSLVSGSGDVATLTTSTFYIVVVESQYDRDAIESSDEYTTVDQNLQQAVAAKEAAEAAAAEAIAASERAEEIASGVVDETLTQSGLAADAKVTGDKFAEIEAEIDSLIDGDLSVGVDVTLTQEGEAADAKATGDRLTTIEASLADLLYTAIAISSFTNNVGTVEMGSKVSSVKLTWSINKTPKTLVVNGTTQTPTASGSVTLTGLNITSNNSWSMSATDERGTTATKSTSVSFLNGVYYGAAAAPGSYNSTFVLGLTKTLRSSKLASFSANPGEGEYIYYCLPTRFGTCEFTVGGFTGGFILVDTISFTNASGYTENYYIYKSDNDNLGSTAVSVA